MPQPDFRRGVDSSHMSDGGDREAKQEESLQLIFATLALLASRTLDTANPTHGDLVRALQACAENPGLTARDRLSNALESYNRYVVDAT